MSARTRSTQPTVASFIAALDSPRQAEMPTPAGTTA